MNCLIDFLRLTFLHQRIAADLESNIKRVFTLPVLPAFDETSIDREKKYSYAVIGSSFDRREKDESRSLVPIDSSEVTRFATALVNIEAERLKLREKIKVRVQHLYYSILITTIFISI